MNAPPGAEQQLAAPLPAVASAGASPSPHLPLVRAFEEALRDVDDEALDGAQAGPQERFKAAVAAAAHVMGLDAPSAAAAAQAAASSVPAQLARPRRAVRGYMDGCFDVMHSGHYNAVRQARMLCDVLVVGVHSNREIEACKGPPVMGDEERMAMVEACRWADEVVFDTPYSPTVELLDRLGCDFCVHGDDTPTNASGDDAFGEMRRAGRMRIVKRTEGVSTTDLVGRLLAAAAGGEGGATFGSASAAGLVNFLPTSWRVAQFAAHRRPGPADRVVYVDGSFDMMHAGHVELLRRARELGTFVLVGVHADEVVRERTGAAAGSGRPVMGVHERALNVLACRHADDVVIGAPWEVTDDLVRTFRVSAVAVARGAGVGAEYASCADAAAGAGSTRYAAARAAGLVREVSVACELSTDAIVARVLENRRAFERRNAARGQKELDYLRARGDAAFVEEL